MDNLDQYFKESSQRPRNLKPPEGQWASIKAKLDTAEPVKTASGNKPLWLRKSWYIAGLAASLLIGLIVWQLSDVDDLKAPSSQGSNIEGALILDQDESGPEANQTLPTREQPGLNSRDTEVDSGNYSPAPAGIMQQAGDEPAAIYASSTDTSPESSNPTEEVSRPIPSIPVTNLLPASSGATAEVSSQSNRLASSPTVSASGLVSLSLAAPVLPSEIAIMPMMAAVEVETSDGWKRSESIRQGWDVSLHTVFLPIGSISSYVTEYSSLPMEGSGAEVFEFDDEEINLFRVNGSGFDIPGRASWFFTASIGASYQFANGLRVGAGVSYFDVSLFGRGGLKSEFPMADETFFLRERRYDNEVLLARLDIDYTVLRKRRFSLSMGATISGRVMSRYLHRHQLFQPFTQTKERLRNENTLFINNSVNQHIVVLPQLELEYLLGKQTSLSLGMGARLGLGLRCRL
ncbi:MAG: hypothetical protein AAGF87_17650 [Bacteroidota bacterium]